MRFPLGSTLLPALLAAAFGAPPAGADGVKLSEAIQQAKQPPADQQPLDQTPPSETKSKTGGDSPPPPPPADFRWAPPPEESAFLVLPPPGWPYPAGPYYGGVAVASSRPDLEWDPELELRAGFLGGGGGADISAIEGYGAGGLLVGAGLGGFSLDLRALRSVARLSGDLSPALRSFDGWAGDAVLRWYPNSQPSVSRWNLALLGRLGRYGWDYANPVIVVVPGGQRVVRSDSIPYRSLLLGVGVEPWRQGSLSFGLTAAGGLQEFGGETNAGFENDVFESRGVFEIFGEFIHRSSSAPAPRTAPRAREDRSAP